MSGWLGPALEPAAARDGAGRAHRVVVPRQAGARALADAVGVPLAGMEPQVPRISLTMPAISSAREAILLITGAGKRETVARVFGSDRTARFRRRRSAALRGPDGPSSTRPASKR